MMRFAYDPAKPTDSAVRYELWSCVTWLLHMSLEGNVRVVMQVLCPCAEFNMRHCEILVCTNNGVVHLLVA